MASSRWILLQVMAAGISPSISLLRPMKLIPPGLYIPPLSDWGQRERSAESDRECGREGEREVREECIKFHTCIITKDFVGTL